MKKTNLALMLLFALTIGVAHANKIESAGDSPRNPAVQEARGQLKEAREDFRAGREEAKADRDERREENKSMREETRAAVEAGEMTKEEAKAAGEARKAENKAAGVAAREERAAARDAVVSKRQDVINTRISAVREKSPEMADTMEKYYGDIMAKVEGLQAKRDEIIAAVKDGSMTGTEAREEFKSFAEGEKAAIKALIAEMKAEVKAMREAMKAEKLGDISGE